MSTEWTEPTKSQLHIILITGWTLFGFGALLFLFALAALLHRWKPCLVAAPPPPDFSNWHASPPKQRQAAVSLIIKALITPALLFRVLSLAAVGFLALPSASRCKELPSSCELTFFVIQLCLIIPSFILNSLFILLSLFWPWLLALTRHVERPFDHLLLEWGVLSAVMWIIVILSLIVAVIIQLDEIYAFISYFSNVVVLINIVVFTFYGIKLIVRMRQFGDQGIRFTRKLFFITFLVLIFAAIRVVFTIFLNSNLYHPKHPTDPFAWIMSYMAWCFFCEFLPELALLTLVANPIALFKQCYNRSQSPFSNQINI